MDAKLRSAGVCPAAKSFLRLRPDNTTSMHHQRILTEHKKKKKEQTDSNTIFGLGNLLTMEDTKIRHFLRLGPKTCLWPKKEKTAWVWFASSCADFFAAIRSFLLCTWLENYLSKNQCIKHDHFYFASRFYARATKCLFFPSCRVVAHFMVLLELH